MKKSFKSIFIVQAHFLLSLSIGVAWANTKATIAPTISDTRWEVINKGGIPAFNGNIYSMKFYKGELYAGGSFTIAKNIVANHIAKWDGINWIPFKNGVNNAVRAIAFDSSGILYVGGDFDSANGSEAHHIAKWDGAQWSTVGTGTDSNVCAFAFDGKGNLFTGGRFTTAGGIPARCTAKWDGKEWSAQKWGDSGPYSYL